MIIDPEHGFSFVHIPKNGGTSLRSVLGRFNAFPGEFNGPYEHPELGPLVRQHLPLHVVKNDFPEAFSALAKTTVFAIYRDPFDRFISAFNHTVRRQTALDQLSEQELIDACMKIIERLNQSETGWPLTTEGAFAPQRFFAYIEGERVVDKLYAIDKIDIMLSEISKLVGEPMALEEVKNTSIRFRYPALSAQIKAIGQTLKRVLPPKLYTRWRNSAVKQLTVRDEVTAEILFARDEICDFIRNFYRLDFELASLTQETGR